MSKLGSAIRKISEVGGSQASHAPTITNDDAIRTLAHELWLKRGCPIGSPEEDWFQAERALGVLNKSRTTAA